MAPRPLPPILVRPRLNVLLRDAVRYSLLRLRARLRYRGQRPIAPGDVHQASRILLVRLEGIGDVVNAIPAIQLFRSLLPGCTIDVLVRPCAVELIEDLQLVDAVYGFEPKRSPDRTKASSLSFFKISRMLHRNRYDVVVNFEGRSYSRWMCFHIGCKRTTTPVWDYWDRGNWFKLRELASDRIAIPTGVPGSELDDLPSSGENLIRKSARMNSKSG